MVSWVLIGGRTSPFGSRADRFPLIETSVTFGTNLGKVLYPLLLFSANGCGGSCSCVQPSTLSLRWSS
jgi:hypothetical protein